MTGVQIRYSDIEVLLVLEVYLVEESSPETEIYVGSRHKIYWFSSPYNSIK
jgi:hypothetical protein